MRYIGPSAKTAYFLKRINGLYPSWRLKYIIKCSSTENELSNFLKNNKIKNKTPIAIIAREQFASYGQNSRVWFAKRGGIWLSAAHPIFSSKFSSEIFSLSFAINLCATLRKEKIKVDLKWPNDIFFGKKKLIGFLPKVITRGKEIKYVRVGIGMNLLNKTPYDGISLSQVLKTRNINEYYWTAKILKAFHDSIVSNDKKEYIINSGNKFLNKAFLPSGFSPLEWKIKDINSDGNLRMYKLTKNNYYKILNY